VCAYTERELFQNSFFELLLEMRRKETIHNVSIFASEAGAAGGTFSPFFDFFVVCVPELPFFHRARRKKSQEREREGSCGAPGGAFL
jgi:hypothetical protein